MAASAQKRYSFLKASGRVRATWSSGTQALLGLLLLPMQPSRRPPPRSPRGPRRLLGPARRACTQAARRKSRWSGAGARPSGVGYGESASSAARAPQLFTSHRPELGPVTTPSVRGGLRACSSFWAATWLAEVWVLITQEGEMDPGRQPVVPAAEDGGDSGLEPSIQRPWRWMGVEGRGA